MSIIEKDTMIYTAFIIGMWLLYTLDLIKRRKK
jgi:hypothetical protein